MFAQPYRIGQAAIDDMKGLAYDLVDLNSSRLHRA